jgi:hypothetical protein
MKFFGAVAVLVAASGAWASDAGQTPARVVTVCLSPGANAAILYRGQAAASQILMQAGIRIEWRIDKRACAAAESGIVVTVSPATPEDRHPGALAYAMPYEGTRIVLFYDRVLNAARPSMAPFLVGHVLAHEIAHILQGISRHSASGIMKAHWDAHDYAQMDCGQLNFTDEDIRLIHSGLKGSYRPESPRTNDRTQYDGVHSDGDESGASAANRGVVPPGE